MLINVTQECIDNGIRRNSNSCPVALALREVLTDAVRVSVTSGIYTQNENKEWDLLCDTPETLWQPIRLFDDTGFMQPFEFELNLEPVSVDLGDDEVTEE